MECSNCGSPSAELHTRVIGGTERTVCLCQACFEKLYSKSDASELFAHMFSKGIAKSKQSKVCPSCGMTLDAFRRSGLLGCSGCYTAFRKEILESVRYCQRDSVHHGKIPSGASEEKYDLVREQEFVKSQMDAALVQGNYKLADQFSRRLTAIHAQLVHKEE